MRVTAIRTKFENVPSLITSLGFSSSSNVYVSLSTEYEVYALSIFQGVVFLQIINDVNSIVWLPAWLFETRDITLPHDWIGNLFQDEPSLVFGPAFVASDMEAYTRMVELAPSSCEDFWQRKENLVS